MRIYKANYLHLYRAALELSSSDREEMDRLLPGRDPINVLTASAGDPTVMHISDDAGNVLAVGGSANGIIWFVHTVRADNLSPRDKQLMLRLLTGHLIKIKREAVRARPDIHYHFTNAVSADNTRHIKLLNFLGATWWDGEVSANGHVFKQFFF